MFVQKCYKTYLDKLVGTNESLVLEGFPSSSSSSFFGIENGTRGSLPGCKEEWKNHKNIQGLFNHLFNMVS